jgi:hypothetical protein
VLDQLQKGYRDFDILNFMFKVKIGGGLQHFSHFWDKTLGYWSGVLCFLLLDVVFHVFSRLLCSGRMIRDVIIPFFLLILDVIFI